MSAEPSAAAATTAAAAAAAKAFAASPEARHGAAAATAAGAEPLLSWLGGATAAGALPEAPQLAEATPAAFEGDPAAFVALHDKAGADKAGAEEEESALARQMRNQVRKCGACGKPNAFTLDVCNACGGDLSQTAITFTPNIFMGFVYGVQKGPFPYTISLRAQTPDMLVFDDLLSLTPAHLNCIPTDVYLPDFRYLLKKPAEGLALVRKMFDSSFAALKTHFLDKAEFRSKVLRGGDKLTDDEIRAHVCAGLNYPPSQYQLHLQFILPPFLPFQWRQYLAGVHFTPGRFVPIDYVEAALENLIEAGDAYTDWEAATPVQETFAFFAKRGVDYDKMHAAFFERAGESHRTLANWDPASFEHVVVGNASTPDVVLDRKSLEPVADKASADLVNADKNVLQNYGRPYNPESGRPTGTYYKYAKKPADVRDGL